MEFDWNAEVGIGLNDYLYLNIQASALITLNLSLRVLFISQKDVDLYFITNLLKGRINMQLNNKRMKITSNCNFNKLLQPTAIGTNTTIEEVTMEKQRDVLPNIVVSEAVIVEDKPSEITEKNLKKNRHRLSRQEEVELKERTREMFMNGHPQIAIALKLDLSISQVKRFLNDLFCDSDRPLKPRVPEYALVKVTPNLLKIFPKGFLPGGCKYVKFYIDNFNSNS